jgi:beta-N-acetylhexosaminidase
VFPFWNPFLTCAFPFANEASRVASMFSQVFPSRQTPETRAGLFVWPSLAGPELLPAEKEILLRYRPSGVVLFRRNLPSLSQGRALVKNLRALLPGVVIAIDEEGGRVARLPWPVPRGLPALQMGESKKLEWVRDQALLQGFVSKGLGIDCIFAPVADILTCENNPVMADRCYGRTADEVQIAIEIIVKEWENLGIKSCPKHFPGHGNTHQDSHFGFAQSDVSLETLRDREWLPFQKAFASGSRLCMTGHILIPHVDPVFPATLSEKILKGHLRAELGFQGLIVSDDLRMNAIAHHYGVYAHVPSSAIVKDIGGFAGKVQSGYLDRAACDALAAGCDILLSCQSVILEEEVLMGVAKELSTNPEFEKEMQTRIERIKQTLATFEPSGA